MTSTRWNKPWKTSGSLLLLSLTLLSLPLASQARSQTSPAQPPKLESCKPASERTGPEGCWILTSSPLGKLPASPIFWTLDLYPTRESAQAALTPGSTVVEALGKTWLFTVGDKPNPSPQSTHVTQIGPIPVKPDADYTAQYREAILRPGAVSRTHLHAGPEIFYTETGESCLETPAGKQLGKKGVDIIAPEAVPMELTATETDMRRGIVLVLHETSKPHTTLVTEWKSQGLCKSNH